MSRRKRKSRNPVTRRNQEILQEYLNCQTTCADLEKIEFDDLDEKDIDALVEKLPGVKYVLQRMLYYIFSNGLTTGTHSVDEETLDPWLYEEQNNIGATNYDVLKSVIGNAAIYGECGLRMYDGDLYQVPKGHFGVLYSDEDGITSIHGYIIRKDGKELSEDIKADDFAQFEDWGDVYQYFDDHGLHLLLPDEFVNIRNDTSLMHGMSPFLTDKERTSLLLSVYERLNYDINYDGPGRIIIRPKDSISDANEVSTGQLLNNSLPAQEERNKKAQAEVARVGRAIKESSSDSVILLSNAFSNEIEHLPRVTKATEFFDWISNDTVIVAQIIGMSPTLLEVGKLHGNVSVAAIIDNAMLNTIIPLRETYAIQFSHMVASRLGVQKVYFDKYDLQQVQDENAEREKVASIIKALSVAAKNHESENVNRLLDQFTDFLRTSIEDEYGKPRTL